MKYKELKTQSVEQLEKTLQDLEAEAHEIAVKIKLNQQKQTHKLRAIRKDIARVKTALHELKRWF